MPARLCARQPDRMHPGVAHQPWPLVRLQPGVYLEILRIPVRHGGVDGDPLCGVVAGADQPPVLAAPTVGHIVIAEEAGRVRVVQPPLHLVGGIRRVGDTGPEVVEEVAHQEETVVWLAFDDLSGSPEFVMNIGEDQPAHCGRGHSFIATRLRSLLPACWLWCQRRTRSRHTPRRLLRCRWSRASSHSILTNPYQDRDMQGRWLLRPTQLQRFWSIQLLRTRRPRISFPLLLNRTFRRHGPVPRRSGQTD